jgi:hypothetical protein
MLTMLCLTQECAESITRSSQLTVLSLLIDYYSTVLYCTLLYSTVTNQKYNLPVRGDNLPKPSILHPPSSVLNPQNLESRANVLDHDQHQNVPRRMAKAGPTRANLI